MKKTQHTTDYSLVSPVTGERPTVFGKVQQKPKDNRKAFHNMKKISFISIFVFLSTAAFYGCVDDVNIENQFNETRKLVLFCRLCPSMDSTYILLSNSQLMYSGHNETSRIISDGTVELSADGINWVSATYDTIRMRYLITRNEFPVVEGGTYYIRASYPGFEEVSASCTVPITHDAKCRIDTVSTEHDTHWGTIYNWPHKDVYVEWHDAPGVENNYAMAYRSLTSYQEDFYDEGELVVTYNWQFYIQTLYDDESEYEYISDEGRDGSSMRFLLEADLYENDDEYFSTLVSQYYLVFLDRNSYLYEKTVTTGGGFDFLLLEPTHTYSNIENGFGVFGAFCLVPVM